MATALAVGPIRAGDLALIRGTCDLADDFAQAGALGYVTRVAAFQPFRDGRI
jgi:hypothetical protein